MYVSQNRTALLGESSGLLEGLKYYVRYSLPPLVRVELIIMDGSLWTGLSEMAHRGEIARRIRCRMSNTSTM